MNDEIKTPLAPASMCVTPPAKIEATEHEKNKQKVQSIRRISRRLLLALVTLMSVAGALMFYNVWYERQREMPVPSTPVLCVILGAVGGFVGLPRRLKQLGEEDLELLDTSWAYVILAPLVGGILALLLYMLFLSKLLSSPLFPTFVLDGDVDGSVTWQNFLVISHVHGGFDDYAKLAFWSFVAGFSERFVVDVIGRFEGEGSRGNKKT